MDEQDAKDLLDAAGELVKQNVGDYTYDVREREGNGWEGVKVVSWSRACSTLERIVRKYKGAEVPQ